VPPRFAYWTILIDNTPTAFRARDREELLPTLAQLKRTNHNVELKWFAQGRLWESPEAQRESWQKPRQPPERRDRDWRPGGQHKDPRARFDKEARRRSKREQRASWSGPGTPRPPQHRDQPGGHDRAPHRERKPGAQRFRPAPVRPLKTRPPHARHGPARNQNFDQRRRRRRDDEPPDHE
jgi:hypothetical protein